MIRLYLHEMSMNRIIRHSSVVIYLKRMTREANRVVSANIARNHKILGVDIHATTIRPDRCLGGWCLEQINWLQHFFENTPNFVAFPASEYSNWNFRVQCATGSHKRCKVSFGRGPWTGDTGRNLHTSVYTRAHTRSTSSHHTGDATPQIETRLSVHT